MDKTKMNIVLIGMPGSGKTTLGNILSRELGKEIVDLDKYLEKREAMTISDMFNVSEDFFRTKETESVKEVSKREGIIISTGGGVVKRKENMDALKRNGIVIFINRPIENILKDVDTDSRPLLKDDVNKLHKLYEERYELYNKYKDIEIVNVGKIDNIIKDLKQKLKEIIGLQEV